MRLRGINLHPVKSAAIRPVAQAYVGAAGLVGDREWMVVDALGDVVTARELPRMFHVVADNAATGGPDGLRLSAPRLGLDPVEVTVPEEGLVEVRVHGNGPLPARSAGPEADAWIRKALGLEGVRLVWCADPSARTLKPSLARPTDHAAFQDGSPVSLASTASMARLNGWMEEERPISRFRANLVVEGIEEAFAEDGWQRVRVGRAVLRVAGPIDRCVMTTIDPETLAKGKDPIRTLAVHRRWGGKTWFAVHLMVEEQGSVAVGDELTVE